MIIIVMGVAGAGKTTVGRELAAVLGWPFFDGDDLHPPDNVAKMARGEPLTDTDRMPWLARLRELIREHLTREAPLVLACSALKAAYRETLAGNDPRLHFVYLKGDSGLMHARLQARAGHFMPPALIDSQFATLEEPAGAVVLDATLPVGDLVLAIRCALGV